MAHPSSNEPNGIEAIVFDPLVLGLTRPPTVAGVPYVAALVNVVVTMIVFIAFADLWLLLVAVPIHLVLMFCALVDLRFLDILQVLAARCPRSMNRSLWGAQSYAP